MNTDRYALMDAMGFAAIKHAKQKRRYSGDPYITHLMRVTERLQSLHPQFDITDDMLKAAALHDAVEDTDCTLEEIEARFGKTVRDYVAALSIDPRAGNRAARMAKYQAQIKAAPLEVQLIKFCDLSDNIDDIRTHDKSFFEVYRREGLKMADALEKIGPRLQNRLRWMLTHDEKYREEEPAGNGGQQPSCDGKPMGCRGN